MKFTAILFFFTLLCLNISGSNVLSNTEAEFVEETETNAGKIYLRTSKPQNYEDTYETKTVREQLKAAGATIFINYIDKVGLGYILDGKGYYTIFAPTNEAFDRLENEPACKHPRYTQEHNKGYDNTGKYSENYEDNQEPSYFSVLYPPQRQYTRSLEATIGHQIIVGNYHLKDLQASNGALIPSINGVPVSVYSYGKNVVINGGTIVRGDIYATNGVVHIVDHIHCLHLHSVAHILSQSYDATFNKFMDVLSMVNILPLIYAGPPVTVLVPSTSEMEEFAYEIREKYEHYFIGSVAKIIEFAQSRILSGFYYAENLRYLPHVKSLFGDQLSVIHKSENEVIIGGHPVSFARMKLGTNGILYVSDYQYALGRNYGNYPGMYGGGYRGYPGMYGGGYRGYPGMNTGGGGGYGGDGYYVEYRPTYVSNYNRNCGPLCQFAII